ncbi:hypothetical protein D3C71_824880 [compost metagenome]
MKKRIFFLFALVLSNICQAQFGNLQIEDRFDAVYEQLYGPIYDINSSTNNINAQGDITYNKATIYSNTTDEITLGSLRTGSLEALLRMYEATCDPKYLWEFMEQVNQIVAIRADKISPLQSAWPYWFKNYVYMHGRLLTAFTHFVHLVKSKPVIYNASIPLAHRPNFGNFTTIGAFADNLNTVNRQTMDFLMTRYWKTAGDDCMCKPSTISATCSGAPAGLNNMELNMQAPFGCALLYLYLANPTEVSYAVKTVQMARAYLVSQGNVLEYNSTYNAYVWHHDGWQRNSAGGSLTNVYYEDIGHGGLDIMFPLLYNKYYNNFYSSITAGQYFEDYQMARFRNTFTKIIYNGSIPTSCTPGSTFDCNVYGTCSGHYGSTSSADYQMNGKNWTLLYKFDNVSGSQPGSTVYSIMMNYYIAVESCISINSNNYGGIGIQGLADMVYANRDKEGLIGCPLSLVLSNENTFELKNPVSESFVVPIEEEISEVRIYDMNGKEQVINRNDKTIFIKNLADGYYILVLKTFEQTIRKRIFVLNNDAENRNLR